MPGMAAANLSDQIEALTRILVKMHQNQGQAAQLRRAGRLEVSHLAKLTGCTPDVIYGFEAGTATPTTGQAIAWLTALYDSYATPGTQTAHLQKAMKASGQSARTAVPEVR